MRLSTKLLFSLLILCTCGRAQKLFTHERQLPGAEHLSVNEDRYPFYHGVASGDPLEDRVVIWTRVTPDSLDGPVDVAWRVATDTQLKNVVRQGSFTTDADRDYTVKIDVDGLQPGTTYYYGFTALNRNSLTGRTKTTPTGDVNHLRFGVVSCSNFQSGYFNGYGRLAERNDLDAVVHLGDYIYEYGNFTVGVGNPEVWDERIVEPDGEIVSLFDYRARYGTYHLDEDLMRLHQQQVMIAVWDDHEFANNSYTGGATNHQEDGEGPWEDRKAAAKQAYFEWMPLRDMRDETVYRTLSYGNLAELIMLDTRIVGRDKQAPLTSDPDLFSPDRTMLGEEQKAWFLDRLGSSTAKWKLIGNQVIFSPFNIGWAGALVQQPFERVESTFLDIWDGYPAERSQIVDFIRDQEVENVVILTGDFHTSMAYEVADPPVSLNLRIENGDTVPIYSPSDYDPTTGAGAVAVEFASPSVASANFDETAPELVALSLQAQINQPLSSGSEDLGNPNPHMKYVNLIDHGYYVLDVLEDRVQADYFYTDVLQRTPGERFDRGWSSPAGGHFLSERTTPAAEKTAQDAPAPTDPPGLGTAVREPSDVRVLALAPNPTAGNLSMQYVVKRAGVIRISMLDATGRTVRELYVGRQPAGLYTLRAELEGLTAGTYLLRVVSPEGATLRRLIKNH